MSKSNPQTRMVHPCERWMEYGGQKGVLSYWDKEAPNPEGKDGKGKRIEMPDGFTFIPVDELCTLIGWNDKLKLRMVANEVRRTKGDGAAPFTLRYGGQPDIIAQGFYAQIQENAIYAKWGHYAASLYIAFKDDEGRLKLGNIQLKGSALTAWIELKSKYKGNKLFDDCAIVMSKGKAETSPDGKIYYPPEFRVLPVSEETNAAASKLDAVLQQYLTAYLAPHTAVANEPSNHEEPFNPDPCEIEDTDDVPF